MDEFTTVQLNGRAISVIHAALSLAHERWAGGHAAEQVDIANLRDDFYRMKLEYLVLTEE